MPFPMLAIDPHDMLSVPSELDGHHGTNRATGKHPQITADTDIDALKAWLARYSDTKNTFDNYRKEAERLLLWSLVELSKPLSSLTHEDMLAYLKFISGPKPKARWVMKDGRKVARSHPNWRPFAGPLSKSSQRQAQTILNAMFAWLVTAGYLAGNPLSLSRQRNLKSKPRIERYLEDDLWEEVKLTIDLMPRETVREREHHLRLRWLFSLLYICGLRISEVVCNTMGGFFRRADKNGEVRWWLEILGKGDKTRLVPATNELMVELARYRQEKGLPPSPTLGEETPLILPIGSRLTSPGRGAVHAIVKKVFSDTSKRLRDRGVPFEKIADRVELASAHWLRHTAGTAMANNGVDLRHVRDNFGHVSLSTTSAYLHSEDDMRHRDTEDKHKIDWSN